MLFIAFNRKVIMMQLNKLFKWLGSVFLLWLIINSNAYSDSEAIDEYKVKAGYIYNFTKFITWADNNNDTFNICILGNDPFGSLIDPIEQRTAFNHPIKLFRITGISKEPHCHIVYFSAGMNPKTFISNNQNTLTVGEDNNFSHQGGIIAFIKKDNKIKLQINLKPLQQSGLKVSAKLLEVSDVIGGEND